ncbi:TPA: hypothetical protein NJ202_004275 [Vibrio parahaemolyticus]|nr:hypothetical protein [Vibrio parahaemolyticus]
MMLKAIQRQASEVQFLFVSALLLQQPLLAALSYFLNGVAAIGYPFLSF